MQVLLLLRVLKMLKFLKDLSSRNVLSASMRDACLRHGGVFEAKNPTVVRR